MLLLCHLLGETYGMLPSQVLKHADTFDITVFDVVKTVRDYHSKKDPNSYMKEENLKRIMDSVRK